MIDFVQKKTVKLTFDLYTKIKKWCLIHISFVYTLTDKIENKNRNDTGIIKRISEFNNRTI